MRAKWAMVVVALCVVVTVAAVAYAVGKASGVPEVIRAQRFEMVDAEGEVRAALRMGTDGSPGMVMYDGDGNLRAGVGLHADGRPNLLMSDEDGNPRVILTVTTDGSPIVTLADADGWRRVVLTVSGADDAISKLLLTGGKSRAAAMLSVEEGCPALTLADEDSGIRSILAAPPELGPTLVFYDGEGEEFWFAP